MVLKSGIVRSFSSSLAQALNKLKYLAQALAPIVIFLRSELISGLKTLILVNCSFLFSLL